MKIFYLTGAVIFTVLILIISFENIAASCQWMNFFFIEINANTSPTFLIMGNAFLGVIAGIFYFGFIHALIKGMNKSEEEEEDEDF